MNKFWTVTNSHTTHTNDRSARFNSIDGALREATSRIERGSTESVCILECVKIVKRAKIPVTIEDVTVLPPEEPEVE